jgi:hypothetical protein
MRPSPPRRRFVHGGLIHLINNLYGLLFAGLFLRHWRWATYGASVVASGIWPNKRATKLLAKNAFISSTPPACDYGATIDRQ